VLRGRQYFLLGGGDVFAAAGDDERWLVAARRGLDVRVGLGAQGFDLATYMRPSHAHAPSYITAATNLTSFFKKKTAEKREETRLYFVE